MTNAGKHLGDTLMVENGMPYTATLNRTDVAGNGRRKPTCAAAPELRPITKNSVHGIAWIEIVSELHQCAVQC